MSDSSTVRDLHDAGLIHTRLVTRTRLLLGISVILLLVSIFDILERGSSGLICLALGMIGFVLGLFVFSKMNKVVWNEEEEVIQAGKMDIFGFGIIVLYVAFEMILRTYLKSEFAGTLGASAYILSAIGASLLGRSLGTLVAIRKLATSEGIRA